MNFRSRTQTILNNSRKIYELGFNDSVTTASDTSTCSNRSFNPGYIEVDKIILQNHTENNITLSNHKSLSSSPEKAYADEIVKNSKLHFDSDDSEKDPNYRYDSSDNSSNLDDIKEKKRKNRSNKSENRKKPESESFHYSNFDENESDNETIEVNHKLLNVISGKSKQHFCYICKSLQTKFARHLELKHKEVEEVAEFLKLPKRDRSRKNLITDIRKKGDYLYNSKVEYNEGNIIVARRPRKNTNLNGDNYKPCGKCGALYVSKSLSYHFRNCDKGNRGKKNVFSSSRLKSYVSPNANIIMKKKILPHMRDDPISEIVRTQDTIIQFGNRLTQKYRSHHLYKMIRARLRCVASFFWHFRKCCPSVHILEDVFEPSHYDDVVKAINILAGLDEESGKYRSPATASTIATMLKKISLHLTGEMIKKKNNKRLEEIRDFTHLLNDGLPYDVYKTVLENQTEQRRRKNVLLPSDDDISKLRLYLDHNIKLNFQKLQRKYIFEVWKELLSLLLISLQVFNRRRAGEIARVKIDDFLNYEKSQNDKGENYVRFLIRGKKARGVPVMLDGPKLKALKLTIKYRQQAGVPVENPYLFGIPGTDEYNHLEAERLMRHYSVVCGASHPKTLRGTELRKHLATNCATWNLGETQIKDIADYMGHEEKIHLSHYRLPNAARDITRISSILEKAQGIENNNILGKESLNMGESSMEEDNNVEEENIEGNTREQSDLGEYDSSIDTQKPKNKRCSWSSEERDIVFKEARFFLESYELPTTQFCENLLTKHRALKRRSLTTLKAFISNEINKRKKIILSSDTSKKLRIRRYWTPEEKNIVLDALKQYMIDKKLPSLPTCKKVIEENILLKGRTPEMLKAFLNNLLRKQK